MGRTQTTIRLDDKLIEEIDEEAEERDVSRSEYVRQILRERHESDELREENDALRERLESREDRISDLEDQLAKRSQIEEKVDTLAKQQDEPEAPFFVKWVRWLRRDKE
jgi:predicted transcriptional regulator